MAHHTASCATKCPRCGTSTETVYVAESRGGILRCRYSLRCANCSLAEEGDAPELYDEARAAFFAAEGRWVVRISDLGPLREQAWRALREMCSEPTAQLLQMVRDAQVVKEGALVEVELLEEALKPLGATVTLSRVPE